MRGVSLLLAAVPVAITGLSAQICSEGNNLIPASGICFSQVGLERLMPPSPALGSHQWMKDCFPIPRIFAATDHPSLHFRARFL